MHFVTQSPRPNLAHGQMIARFPRKRALFETTALALFAFAAAASFSDRAQAQTVQAGPVLPTGGSVSSGAATVTTGTTTLRAGDTDQNGAIDLQDAALIGANFGITVPPAPSETDLNGDGVVNISDLVLVGGNFGLTGALTTP